MRIEQRRPLDQTSWLSKLLVAEDHLVARVGVSAIINRQPDMLAVTETSNGREAIERYRRHQPNVTLLDLRMPLISGVEAAIAILKEFPGARFIALTSYGGDEDIGRALAASVHAYLTKDVPGDELLQTIRTVYAGGTDLPLTLAATLKAQGDSPTLSKREIEVLELAARGLSNKQIAYSTQSSDEATGRGVMYTASPAYQPARPTDRGG